MMWILAGCHGSGAKGITDHSQYTEALPGRFMDFPQGREEILTLILPLPWNSLGSLGPALDAGISSPSCSWQLSQQIQRAYEQETPPDYLRRLDDLIHPALDDPHKRTQTKTIALAHTIHNPLQISERGPLFSFEYNGGIGNCDTAIKFLSKQIIKMELRGPNTKEAI